MASPRTYECFTCKRNGVGGVEVYLDGKDSEGRTKYLNEDMSPHTHHHGIGTSMQESIASRHPGNEEILPLLRTMNAKLDRLLDETSKSDNRAGEEDTDGLLID